MIAFKKTIRYITNINKWMAFFILTLLMFLVAVFSIARMIGHPIIGDIELVQLMMVLLIVGSLGFSERTNSHISIGLIVDKLPDLIQVILDIIAHTITFIFTILVAWVFVSNLNFVQASDLMKIPFAPFKILLVIGFAGWGLEALLKLLNSFHRLIIKVKKGGDRVVN